MKLQSAVKRETAYVAVGTAVMSILMIAVFYGLHAVMPQVPTGLPVILGGVLGCAAAVGNFFLMALTVQKVASIEHYDTAYRTMQISYRYRTFLQLGWCVLAMVLRFINPVAGILPLLWPSLLIKARGIITGMRPAAADEEAAETDTETGPSTVAEENAGKEVNE